eukprot:98232-Hanusia_phi.AAC.2
MEEEEEEEEQERWKPGHQNRSDVAQGVSLSQTGRDSTHGIHPDQQDNSGDDGATGGRIAQSKASMAPAKLEAEQVRTSGSGQDGEKANQHQGEDFVRTPPQRALLPPGSPQDSHPLKDHVGIDPLLPIMWSPSRAWQANDFALSMVEEKLLGEEAERKSNDSYLITMRKLWSSVEEEEHQMEAEETSSALGTERSLPEMLTERGMEKGRMLKEGETPLKRQTTEIEEEEEEEEEYRLVETVQLGGGGGKADDGGGGDDDDCDCDCDMYYMTHIGNSNLR